MQIKSLPKSIYTLYSLARTSETLSHYKNKYQDQIDKWQELKRNKCCDKVCAKVLGFSKATFYRRKQLLSNLEKGIAPPLKRPHNFNKPKWAEKEKQLILRIRRENPTYGKEKIAVILKRDCGVRLSVSTVGRIIKNLIEKGYIEKSITHTKRKRRRRFNKGHAKAWSYKNYKEIKIGERIQIDHMSVTKNQIPMKHFQAWDRNSKYIHANVYSNAKAISAKRFLLELIEVCPFKITSIQVDGGSEFMAEFEAACADLDLELLVLPPNRPIYNGGVERGNRIFREEFYAREFLNAESIVEFRYELNEALKKYNTFRPHFSLHGLTPIEYINNGHFEA